MITGDAAGDDVTDAAGITDVEASGAGLLDDNSRIFDARAGLTLDGLTLTGGRTRGREADGGAVRATGDLTVRNSTVAGNSTAGRDADGGGICCNGSWRDDELTLVDSTISGNNAASGGGIGVGEYGFITVRNSLISGNNALGSGGGISGYSVQVTNSTVSGNSASADGGGIRATGGEGPSITVRNSKVNGNSAEDGGGIWVEGVYSYFTLKNSTVNGNSATGIGGGIVTGAQHATVQHSTISGNSASSDGGIFGSYRLEGPGTVLLTNSTVSGNSATRRGGGIRGYTVTVTNGTISGNTAAKGGGIFFTNAEYGYGIDLEHSTVSGNTAGDGGAIFGRASYKPGVVDLTNCIVLGNRTTIRGREEVGGDWNLVLTGSNIVGRDVFSGMSDVGDTSARQVFDRTVEVAGGVLAGRLADNGGPTRTIALYPDVTNPALGGASPGKAPAKDQRGEARDAAPDLGAFEAAPVDGLVLVGGRGGRCPGGCRAGGPAGHLQERRFEALRLTAVGAFRFANGVLGV